VTLSPHGAGLVDLGLEQLRPDSALFENAIAVAEEFPAVLAPTAKTVDQHGTAEGWERLCAELATGEGEMTSPPE